MQISLTKRRRPLVSSILTKCKCGAVAPHHIDSNMSYRPLDRLDRSDPLRQDVAVDRFPHPCAAAPRRDDVGRLFRLGAGIGDSHAQTG